MQANTGCYRPSRIQNAVVDLRFAFYDDENKRSETRDRHNVTRHVVAYTRPDRRTIS